MIDETLDRFDPFDISHNDFIRLKPQALTAIYEIGLEVIGQDEPGIPFDAEFPVTTDGGHITRNQLRKEQRKAWAKACGVAEK